MKNKGFTIMEVIISCGILALFMTGVISLYSSGSKMSNSAMWLQNVTSQLKTASRQINTSIRKSSYPSRIEYPKKIVESRQPNFFVGYIDGLLQKNTCGNGRNFLVTTEATPGKTGGSASQNCNATLTYHVFTLASNGNLTYTRYSESVVASNITESFSRAVPSGRQEYKSVLVKDVNSITCRRILNGRTDRTDSPIEITIECKMPKNASTTRREITVGTPNVQTRTL